MKKIVIITLFSYLLYSTLPAFAAAPPAAGAGSSSMRAVENQLTDWWALYHTMPDAIAEQLAKNYLAQNDNPMPSMQALKAFFNEGGEHMLPPSIIKLTHRTLQLMLSNPIVIKPVARFEGDYDTFSQAIWAEIQSALQGRDGSYLRVNLNNKNLGAMQPEQVSRFIQELQGHIRQKNCHMLSLELSRNRLTTLQPGTFNGLHYLQELYLDHNQLRTLPSTIFSGIRSLRTLGLSFNPLTTSERKLLVQRLLSELPNLQEVLFEMSE